MTLKAIRGTVVSFRGDPFLQDPASCLVHEPDAVVTIDGGRIAGFGPAADMLGRLPAGTPLTHYPVSTFNRIAC